MVPTRRRFLGGAAALLAALAGCNGSTDAPTVSDAPRDPERPANVVTDPPTVTLRRPLTRDPIVDVSDADGERDATERERRRAVERGFVTTPEAASMLRFDDTEGAERARQFLSETDFETEFVYVDGGTVGRCYRRVLCYVAWSPAELRLAYAEVYRDYDVACSADERDRVTRVIRLEGTVDATEIDSGGTLTHRGGCPVPPRRRSDPTEGRNGTATANDAAGGDRSTDANSRLGGRSR